MSRIRVDIEDLRKLNDINKLAEIFSHRLNYEYVNTPISTRRWKEEIVKSIVNNEIKLLAKNIDFHIIYCKLTKLLLGLERPIINQLLKEYPYLLVIFSDSNLKNWHFVNIKYDDEVKNRRLFRRIVIGPDERLHTAAQRINMLEVTDENISPLELQIRHDEAFDVEKVTKDFYISILRSFYKLVGGEVSVGSQKESYANTLRLLSITDHRKKQEFATRLIGRIIFCWFLKKKKSLQGKTLISEDFFSSISLDRYSNYYHTVLEPLFFQQLNTPLEFRRDKYKNPDIPFLNGGLFQPHYYDFYEVDDFTGLSKHINNLVIPDRWFKELFKILERYNFTVDESTPLDIDLSINPEILGRIFENLLAEINPETGETARKSTGSYYTPRAVVAYMVDESLTHYLEDKTDIDAKRISKLLSYNEDMPELTENEKMSLINALDKLKIIDPACGSGAFPMGILQKAVLILQKIDPDCKMWVDKQISRIDEVYLRKLLEQKLKKESLNYIRKLGIIQNTVYGVDNQPMAVEIAKLRFFLSLIVDVDVDDAKENRGIEPLPNLEFKFVCANSLIALPKDYVLFERDAAGNIENLINQLKKEIDVYFASTQDEKKTAIENIKRIKSEMFDCYLKIVRDGKREGIVSILSVWDPFSDEPAQFFDPEWMFTVSDGFDIAIANPPYIGEKGHKEIFREIRKNPWGKKYYQGKMDIFYFFFHRSLDLLKEKGIVSFITTNYYITAFGAHKLRKNFYDRATILHLINFNELKIFPSSLGQHNMITILKKGNFDTKTKNCITKRTGIANSNMLFSIVDWQDELTDYFEVKQDDLYDTEEFYIRLQGESSKGNNLIDTIINRMRSASIPLGVISNVNTGIMGGCDYINRKNFNYCLNHTRNNNDIQINDGVFVLDELNKRDIQIIKKLKGCKFLKKFYKNSDIQKYNCKKKTTKWIIFSSKDNSAYKNPDVRTHLDKFSEILKKIREINNEKLEFWPYLRRGTSHQKIFEVPKIVAPQRSKTNTFGYNEIPWYASADVYFITQKNRSVQLKYILALLNSRLYYLWLYLKGKRKGETLELYQKPLSEIPLKIISQFEQKPFIDIVDQILAITKEDDYLHNETKQAKVKEYEQQINKKVYELYELTPEEIKVVEEFKK